MPLIYLIDKKDTTKPLKYQGKSVVSSLIRLFFKVLNRLQENYRRNISEISDHSSFLQRPVLKKSTISYLTPWGHMSIVFIMPLAAQFPHLDNFQGVIFLFFICFEKNFFGFSEFKEIGGSNIRYFFICSHLPKEHI